MRATLCFAALLLVTACQKGTDEVAPFCALPETTSGTEITYNDLIDARFSGGYALRGMALGVDGRTGLAKDVFVTPDARVHSGRTRCKSSDGGVNSFQIREVDPNLNIPISFNAADGRYTRYLDLKFSGDKAEGRISTCEIKTFARFLSELRAGGADVRIFRDGDGVFLMVERLKGEPFIYRAKIYFAAL